MPRKLNAMVAGGTGYIGSFLIELMRDDDTFENVFIIDSRFRPELLVGLPPKFHFIQMDIADVDVLRPLLKNIDVMFLLVAVVEAETHAVVESTDADVQLVVDPSAITSAPDESPIGERCRS